jgi:NADH-quinone oxidoreductase subunit G
MDLGFCTEGGIETALDNSEIIFNLGADELLLPEKVFTIYQGSHGDRGAHGADIIFPSSCYTEESGIFVNTEGRPQMGMRANSAPGVAKENWAIIRALSERLGLTLEFDSLQHLRKNMIKEYPHFGKLDYVQETDWIKAKVKKFKNNYLFESKIKDFYKTNPIARASLIMNELSKTLNNDKVIKAAE